MTDIDYRSWGQSHNCHGCRYWSEMLARSNESGGIVAMCLASGPKATKFGTYVGRGNDCAAWESGELGAIDAPGGNPYSEEITP